MTSRAEDPTAYVLGLLFSAGKDAPPLNGCPSPRAIDPAHSPSQRLICTSSLSLSCCLPFTRSSPSIYSYILVSSILHKSFLTPKLFSHVFVLPPTKMSLKFWHNQWLFISDCTGIFFIFFLPGSSSSILKAEIVQIIILGPLLLFWVPKQCPQVLSTV